MAPLHLTEVDTIEIAVLVDNELDPISAPQNPVVQAVGSMQGIPLTAIPVTTPPGGDAKLELRMDSICCAAHGLSLLITAIKGDTKHQFLFDAGPEEDVWQRNVDRLRTDIGGVEHVHLSHWHRDHSGGLPRALQMITAAKPAGQPPVVVDLHPARPDFRGIQIPNLPPISLEADPTFDALAAAGATVVKSSEAHTVLDGFFGVSGEIPRQTTYEEGIRGAVRYKAEEGTWESDPLILDERLVVMHLKDKGLVVFTGCSHAGVVNACRHAVALVDTPLYAVVGGYHLADGDATKLASTVHDLEQLRPTVVMPGHCTGWRFKFAYEQAVPGSVVPSFVGSTYTLSSKA